MKKLLLLLCSIGANAAFADDTCRVWCMAEQKDYTVKKVEPTIEEKFKVVRGKITNKSPNHTININHKDSIYFMDTVANYDKYLDACIKSATKSQMVRQVACFSSSGEDVMWHNPVHNTLQDILKDNPKLAAFTEIKAFGDLVAENKNLLIITEHDPSFVTLNMPNFVTILDRAIADPIGTFTDLVTTYNKFRIPSDSAEAVGLFFSRYLHENRGLLDNLPSSYGLTKRGKSALSQAMVSITGYDRTTKNVSIKIDLTLEPNKLINKKYNPDVTAEMSIPLVLHTKDYDPGNKKQKLTIDVPKTGPLVKFYNTKTKKPVDAKTNAELWALAASNMTDLKLSDSDKVTNSDTFKSADLIKKP